jgi:hypothetical protein
MPHPSFTQKEEIRVLRERLGAIAVIGRLLHVAPTEDAFIALQQEVVRCENLLDQMELRLRADELGEDEERI